MAETHQDEPDISEGPAESFFGCQKQDCGQASQKGCKNKNNEPVRWANDGPYCGHQLHIAGSDPSQQIQRKIYQACNSETFQRHQQAVALKKKAVDCDSHELVVLNHQCEGVAKTV